MHSPSSETPHYESEAITAQGLGRKYKIKYGKENRKLKIPV